MAFHPLKPKSLFVISSSLSKIGKFWLQPMCFQNKPSTGKKILCLKKIELVRAVFFGPVSDRVLPRLIILLFPYIHTQRCAMLNLTNVAEMEIVLTENVNAMLDGVLIQIVVVKIQVRIVIFLRR